MSTSRTFASSSNASMLVSAVVSVIRSAPPIGDFAVKLVLALFTLLPFRLALVLIRPAAE